jgi:PadR family transcriptional regulator, regulatory protein AphA
MPLNHAILAFLDFEPMTGYDLKKYFDISVTHFWSATQSHIYKSLDKLKKNGWTESQVIQQEGRPNRKEHHITPDGQAELRRWLTTSLPLEPIRHAWLIQVFFSHFSSDEEIVNLLSQRIAEIREIITTFKEEAQPAIDANAERVGVARAQELWQMTLDYGLNNYEAELAWLEKTLERVRSLSPLMPPGS